MEEALLGKRPSNWSQAGKIDCTVHRGRGVCTRSAKIKLGQLGLKSARSVVAAFQTGRESIRRAYWRDGKDHRSIRHRCHRCICNDLRRNHLKDQTASAGL